MKTKCNKIRKTLLECAEVELLTPELKEAKLHIEECSDCRLFFIQRDYFRKFIKNKIQDVAVPATVREEIMQNISKKKLWIDTWKRRRKNFGYYSAAVLLVAALLISYLFYFSPSKHNINVLSKTEYKITEELVEDYIRYKLSEQPVEYATEDAKELANWFNGKLDFTTRFSSLNGFTLSGGRLCYLLERRIALAFYYNSDHWVSLFICRDSHLDLSGLKTISKKNKTFWVDESKGYKVVLWKQNDLLYALVSDNEILNLANQLN